MSGLVVPSAYLRSVAASQGRPCRYLRPGCGKRRRSVDAWRGRYALRYVARRMAIAQYDPDIYRANPSGDSPTCKPVLGLQARVCERCGRTIVGGPCRAVPPEQRWGPDWRPVNGDPT